MLKPYHRIMKSEKKLVSAVSWSLPQPETQKIGWLSPLEINGVTEQGLFLRGVCYENRPNEAVTFQIEMGQAHLRARLPLCRIDWRPIAATHRNERPLAKLHDLPRSITGSHVHPFLMNWDESLGIMRPSNLPVASEIPIIINTFNNLLAFLGAEFNVVGVEKIPEPNWFRKLL